MQKLYDTIVIGAGQAGLAMGYQLTKTGRTFLIVDANRRIGDSWRNRYDSLILFTPRSHSSLPGMEFPGVQAGYPDKNEIADYLEKYANKFALPINLETKIDKVTKTDEGIFRVLTDSGYRYKSKNVIVATGPFQRPYYPEISSLVPDEIFHIHAAHYINKEQLKDGTTVVVGGGNSGMQIAAELSKDREVYISVGKKPAFLPNEIMGKSLFWWFDLLGISKWTIHSVLGRFLQKNDPIIGREAKLLIKQGKITAAGRTTAVQGSELIFNDGIKVKPKNIIWATGYVPDYRVLDFPEAFNENGQLIHTRGITSVSGLYFLGLSWQNKRGSALLLGVAEDAGYITVKLQ